jgi:hypothetical protein
MARSQISLKQLSVPRVNFHTSLAMAQTWFKKFWRAGEGASPAWPDAEEKTATASGGAAVAPAFRSASSMPG